jgi:Fe/S biogenesis protein NfuA
MSSKPDFTITEDAKERILEFLQAEELAGTAIRVQAEIHGLKYSYDIGLADESEPRENDVVIKDGPVAVWMEENSYKNLQGGSLDYVSDTMGGRFKFENPNEEDVYKDKPIAGRIQALIDAEINPFVASHGGVISLLDFKEGTAYIHMGGGCQGCASSAETLKMGVEQRLIEGIEEVEKVVDTTDHAAGANPYYQG